MSYDLLNVMKTRKTTWDEASCNKLLLTITFLASPLLRSKKKGSSLQSSLIFKLLSCAENAIGAEVTNLRTRTATALYNLKISQKLKIAVLDRSVEIIYQRACSELSTCFN